VPNNGDGLKDPAFFYVNEAETVLYAGHREKSWALDPPGEKHVIKTKEKQYVTFVPTLCFNGVKMQDPPGP